MLMFGRPIPTAEVVEKVDAVDAAAVSRVAERLLQQPLTLAAMGPVGHLEPYDRILERLA